MVITDFDPHEDVLVFGYDGSQPPDPIFTEDDDGLVRIEIAGQTVAVLQGADYVDVQGRFGSTITLVDYTA